MAKTPSYTLTSGITLETPVSIRVGSDQYSARVVKVTASQITARMGSEKVGEEHTFRKNKWGRWKSGGSYILVIGESETVLDPSF